MRRVRGLLVGGLAGIIGTILAAPARSGQDGPIVVRVAPKPGGGFQLLRGGRPYFIKGVGLENGTIAAAKQAGANSVRTWGADDLGTILDEAHRHGMTVAAGIWLGHPRHGFRYDDPAQVRRQLEQARAVIERHKDHPALLIWGIGNEMEGDGRDEAVWRAVNDIARVAKQIDPNHPTMTVISEFVEGPAKVQNLHRLCPDIDIVGLNSYGPVATLADRYARAGGTKPYVVTEFGPAGQWETPKTPWGAAPEATSTQKADAYRRAYESVVLRPNCLGSYAFIWGWKQEATATWFGLLLPDGSKLGAVDALTEFWTGNPPTNRCPTIAPIALEGPAQAAPGATLRATLAVEDPDGDPVEVAWVLQREGTYGAGGDREAVPPTFPDAIVESDARHAVVRLPGEPGGYRLFAYARDGRGAAATANVPLLVRE
jgi:hypothetical protein